MKLKDLIKSNPGLQYVADSLELMSSAGRRVMLNTEFSTDAVALEAEWHRTAQAIEASGECGIKNEELIGVGEMRVRPVRSSTVMVAERLTLTVTLPCAGLG